MTDEPGTVYLLHLEPNFKHARHYIGWTRDLDRRLAHHRKGTGANFCKKAVEAGCELVLARTWDGTRTDERRLHDRKDAPRICPICRAKGKGR